MHALYDKLEYRGRENTYRKIADKYWWEGMHDNIKEYIQICETY
jgi:Ni,Fe-hydrogenase I cytochrome b subunit